MTRNVHSSPSVQASPVVASVAKDSGPDPLHAAELLLHLARLVHGGQQNDCAQTLTPAQWTALRYFARANRLSRTPSAFSEFHATTRGTASQVVKSLIVMGLLERRANQADGRSTLIEVTPDGHERLRHDPLVALGEAIEGLPDEVRKNFARGPAQVGLSLARARRGPVFGNCADCSHCDRSQPDAPWCHCLQGRLESSEMSALCIDFAPQQGRQ